MGTSLELIRLSCPGALLQTVQLAQLYPGAADYALRCPGSDRFTDSKTFVDKPGRFPAAYLNTSFTNLTSSGNLTYAALEAWIEDNFLGEGTELEAANITDFDPAPAFLQNVSDPYVRGFAQEVNGAHRISL